MAWYSMLVGDMFFAVGIYWFGYSSDFFRGNAVYLFAEMNKLPAIICAVVLFLGFKNWNKTQSVLINKIAVCTFGVYLLHDNPQIRFFLWEKLLKNRAYISDISFPIHVVGSIFLVFVVGIIIEWGRQCVEKNISILKGENR